LPCCPIRPAIQLTVKPNKYPMQNFSKNTRKYFCGPFCIYRTRGEKIIIDPLMTHAKRGQYLSGGPQWVKWVCEEYVSDLTRCLTRRGCSAGTPHIFVRFLKVRFRCVAHKRARSAHPSALHTKARPGARAMWVTRRLEPAYGTHGRLSGQFAPALTGHYASGYSHFPHLSTALPVPRRLYHVRRA
jgi:hypothetical protein